MIDPEIAQMLQAMQDAGEPPLFLEVTATEARRRGVNVRNKYYPPVLHHVARVDERSIPGPGGDIPIRVYWPEHNALGATVVFFHGGGWIIGDLDSHDGHARRLAHTIGAVVVHVGYRLAPEHPFPAGYDDCVAAITWVHEHVDELGGRRDKVAVAGDSAGGNLAAVVAQHCRDTDLPLAAQLLIYPPTDLQGGLNGRYDQRVAADEAGDEADERDEGEGFFTGQDDWVERQYLGGDLSQTADPRVSPLLAQDLTNLPPTVIGIGSHDFLHLQALAYAEALQGSGVSTLLREYPDLIHGFFGMGGISGSAERASDQLTRDLRELLADTPNS
jgi:acetyl esterase/lipase